MEKRTVTIIIPFYKGNMFLTRLFNSINEVATYCRKEAVFDVVLVNDSPEIEVKIPKIDNQMFKVKVLSNKVNSGIQITRINGLLSASGDWIIFLDQDDELIADGFKNQLKIADDADVVVGNSIYEFSSGRKTFYKNLKKMNYVINKRRFLEIHNMIPSPGECLIRKSAIPQIWKSSPLVNNGSDDYFLWLLLFLEKRKFVCNEKCVYIHNDANGENLSLDLTQMYKSSREMCGLLKQNNCINDKDLKKLEKSIEFKYMQDMGELSIISLIKYFDVILNNIVYKLCN